MKRKPGFTKFAFNFQLVPLRHGVRPAGVAGGDRGVRGGRVRARQLPARPARVSGCALLCAPVVWVPLLWFDAPGGDERVRSTLCLSVLWVPLWFDVVGEGGGIGLLYALVCGCACDGTRRDLKYMMCSVMDVCNVHLCVG
jgi:hypothetical protein